MVHRERLRARHVRRCAADGVSIAGAADRISTSRVIRVIMYAHM